MGIGGLQIVLEKGQEEDWFTSEYIVIMSIAAGIGLIGFIWRQLAVKLPILDLSLLKQRRFAVGTLFTYSGLRTVCFRVYHPGFLPDHFRVYGQSDWIAANAGAIMTGLMMPRCGRSAQ